MSTNVNFIINLISLSICLCLCLLFLFVDKKEVKLFKNKKLVYLSRHNFHFAILILISGIYPLAEIIRYEFSLPYKVLSSWLDLLQHFIMAVLVVYFFIFIQALLRKKLTKYILTVSLIAGPLALLLLVTDLFYVKDAFVQNILGIYQFKSGPLFPLFHIILGLTAIYGHFIIIGEYKKNKFFRPTKMFIIIGFGLLIIGGILDGLARLSVKYDVIALFSLFSIIGWMLFAYSLLSMLTNLYKNVLQSKELKKEVDIAAGIQKAILPTDFSHIKELDIFAMNIPAQNISGDFYDCIPTGDNKYGLCIADVCGKNIPAALFMALSKNIIRVVSSYVTKPVDIFRESNRFIYSDSINSMFVTLFYTMIDPEKNEIIYANAGHIEQVLLHNESDKISILHVPGIPLGIEASLPYQETKINYQKGDKLILFTDGIIEGMNKSGIEYGFERFAESIKENRKGSAKDMGKALIKEFQSFTVDSVKDDDVTILVVNL